ncbi:MAG: hypothetical protein Q4D82_01475 [Neisseria sp.]|nr:hypothetical protein [Neisseria sp.]
MVKETVDLANLPEIDLRLYRGDSAVLEFEVNDAAGVPLALGGASITMQARRDTGKPDTLFSLSSAGGEITFSDGLIRIGFTAPLLQTATWRTAVYDVETAFADGRRYTLWRGCVELVHDVTKGNP